MKHYQISDEMLSDLSGGASSPATLAILRSSQLSKYKLLLVYLASEIKEYRKVFATLFSAEERDPGAFAELLLSPFVGAWAAACAGWLRGVVRGATDASGLTGGVAGLAAVAALRCGLDAELRLRPRDGDIVLPTLGVLRLGLDPDALVRAEIRDGAITLRWSGGTLRITGDPAARDGADSRWAPIRHLRADADGWALTVALVDVDPERDCYGKRVADRLPDAAVAEWAERLRAAWSMIVGCAPDRARELVAGLRAMVPLSQEHGPGLSATSRTAFGAFGLTLPDRPDYLAATLIHEFQHSKLSALLDLLPLYDPGAGERYDVPWRPDPRPIGGVLQGVYAFTAVSEFWSRLRGDERYSAEAIRQFSEVYEQVGHVLGRIERAPSLTADGRLFLAGIRSAHARLMDPSPWAQAGLDPVAAARVAAA